MSAAARVTPRGLPGGDARRAFVCVVRRGRLHYTCGRCGKKHTAKNDSRLNHHCPDHKVRGHKCNARLHLACSGDDFVWLVVA